MSPEGIQPNRDEFRIKGVSRQAKDKKRKDPSKGRKFAEIMAGEDEDINEALAAHEDEREEKAAREKEQEKEKPLPRPKPSSDTCKKLDLEA